MFWRKLLGAGGVLALIAGASWLPVRAVHLLPASAPPVAGLARAALAPPESWPAAASDPVQAVRAFFWSLGAAVAGQYGAPAQPGSTAAGPFARAYAYLSPAWQDRQSFAEFLRHWGGVRHLDLLAALPAGNAAGQSAARIFVEVRQLSAGAEGAVPLCLCFAYGFFSVGPSQHGYRLDGGRLTPEDFGTSPAQRRPPADLAAAAAKAMAADRGWSGQPSASVRLTPQPHHQASAAVDVGDHRVTVQLYELASGTWIVLRSSG